MPPLIPCPACERHVRASETRCPFCGVRYRKPGSPLLAAALGAVVLTSAGCPKGEDRAVVKYGAPPPPAVPKPGEAAQPAKTDAGAEAGDAPRNTGAAPPPERAVPEDRAPPPPRTEPEAPAQPRAPAPAYGAPPPPGDAPR